jgi:hypothetical protein
MAETKSPSPDPDLTKGAVEGPPNNDAQGNRNAEDALNDQGLPEDCVAIAEDVIGANADETQG